MIDHISVRVQDLPKLLAFYRAALAPIGYEVIKEFPGTVGLGQNGMPDFWLTQTDKPLNPGHFGISASREAIHAFHAAALAAGGIDNGAPGLRAAYHPDYYAAYVLDPEGNNVEVVCHVPPGAPKVAKKSVAKNSVAKKSVKAAAARKPAAKKKPARPSGKAKAKPKAKKATKAPAKKRR
jgi:catechol 2,3-dioxygenase-like lactoylglutathione lyase family enzyme